MKPTLVLAALLAAAFASPVAAQNPGAIQAVGYSDLNLRTEAGVDRLDRRLRAAVRNVCGTPSAADPLGRVRVQECREATAALATAQRDRAVVAARGGVYAEQR